MALAAPRLTPRLPPRRLQGAPGMQPPASHAAAVALPGGPSPLLAQQQAQQLQAAAQSLVAAATNLHGWGPNMGAAAWPAGNHPWAATPVAAAAAAAAPWLAQPNGPYAPLQQQQAILQQLQMQQAMATAAAAAQAQAPNAFGGAWGAQQLPFNWAHYYQCLAQVRWWGHPAAP